MVLACQEHSPRSKPLKGCLDNTCLGATVRGLLNISTYTYSQPLNLSLPTVGQLCGTLFVEQQMMRLAFLAMLLIHVAYVRHD